MAKESDFILRLRLDNEEAQKKLAQQEKQIASLKKKIASMKGGGGFSLGGLAKMAGGLAGIASAASLVTSQMQRAFEVNKQFEQSLANLSALTGATGKDLDSLAQSAIELSSGSSMAASDIVDAMAKVGGAMPQLLQFQEGLVAVTGAAKTLSAATGMDMDQSINSLTSMMNQFGAGAIQAERYVNILAAASQEGSAEVDYLSAAIERSAGAATMSGLSFEELVATIESIAPKFSSAEEAGTQLRNVLLRLETRMGENSISAVGLGKSLEALGKLDTKQQIKIVGEETLRMAQAMQQARGTAEEMQQAIQGTNSAQEQAAVRTDTLDSALGRLSTSWDNFLLSLQSSTGILAEVVNGLGEVLSMFSGLVTKVDDATASLDRLTGNARDKGFKAASSLVEEEQRSAQSSGESITWAEARARALKKAQAELKKYKDILAEDQQAEADFAQWNQQFESQPLESMFRWAKQNPYRGKVPRSRQYNLWSLLPESDRMYSRQALNNAQLVELAKSQLNRASDAPLFSSSGHTPATNSEAYQKILSQYYAPENAIEQWEAVIKGLEEDADAAAKAQQQARASLTTPKAATRKTGTAKKVTDPLAAVSGDLGAAGLDVGELRKQLTTAEAAAKKVQELDALLRVVADPGTRDKLKAIREELAGIATYTEPTPEARTVVGGLDVTALDETKKKADELSTSIETLEGLLQYAPGDKGLKQALTQLREQRAALVPKQEQPARASDQWAAPKNRFEEEAQNIGKMREEYALLQAQMTEMDAFEQESAQKRLAELGQELQLRQQSYQTQLASAGVNAFQSLAGTLQQLGLINNKLSQAFSIISSIVSTVQAIVALVELIKGASLLAEGGGGFFSFLGGLFGFAQGGVVPGTSYTGDKVLARVNSGEMILTRQQQAALFNGMQAPVASGSSLVRGEDIYLALSNYMRRTGKRF